MQESSAAGSSARCHRFIFFLLDLYLTATLLFARLRLLSLPQVTDTDNSDTAISARLRWRRERALS
jgi:hypothetical protein